MRDTILEVLAARDTFVAFLADLARRTAHINYDSEFDTLYVFAAFDEPPDFREQPRAYQVAPGTMIEVFPSTGTTYGVEVHMFSRLLEEYDTATDLQERWQKVPREGMSEVDGHRLSDALAHANIAH
jgi:hypothetical protein